MDTKFALQGIDYLVMAVYFVFVLGIGWALRKYMKNASAFLEAGRSIPAWVAGLAFISTNLGALEVMGMTGSGLKYGMLTTHFYWIGAIPAMVFLALFMMRFYYGSKARSVPEYLKLRFNEKTRALNAFLFALMTVLASGISMYALAILLENVLGWNFNVSLLASAAIVLAYTYLGGLSSAIYNEVLQFFIIIIGLLPMAILVMVDVGGWGGMQASLGPIVEGKGFAPDAWTTTWKYTATAGANPMGVEWYGILAGLGFVLSFGYWCTNFLIVQRAMAAESMTAARKVPLIGAIPKMFIPFLIIIPGVAALVLLNDPLKGFALPVNDAGQPIYDYTIIMLLKQYLPAGVLGLGITALLASFMSGMAGNVSAFNTVWTYDIYQSYLRPATGDHDADENHYLKVGRITTVVGVLVSIAAAYIASKFGNIMDFLQTVFSMINAPLFAVIFLGMFWKRSTGNAAFTGLLVGFLIALLHHGLTMPAGADTLVKGGWLGVVHTYPVEMAQNFWTAIFAFSSAALLTVIISLLSKREKSDAELNGLVYSMTPKLDDSDVKWYQRPWFLAAIVGVIMIVLSILFW
ncbi:MAG: sodium:solute symporter family protein [Bacteroidales bacterium]|jgi:SSS family solute:Na+ symporter|nr:sodium:solute symporter family protein [Bacteroidales bacterium]MCB9029362.1 sodium:solute symporter family protein [Bacteroidales bacterium]MDD3735678.1 sodium:solute symporter family protein [Bacteroidales bacterium]NLD63863.1 sodium:solute symporter family protein [Bacteroidales bacterium]HNT92197.1 sodium:solute symporter family protein [Bacteroidales bacterium]